MSRFDPPVISSPPSRNGIFVSWSTCRPSKSRLNHPISCILWLCWAHYELETFFAITRQSCRKRRLVDGAVWRAFRTKSTFQFIKSAKRIRFHVIGNGLSREIKPVNNSNPVNPKILLLLGMRERGLSPEILSLLRWKFGHSVSESFVFGFFKCRRGYWNPSRSFAK